MELERINSPMVERERDPSEALNFAVLARRFRVRGGAHAFHPQYRLVGRNDPGEAVGRMGLRRRVVYA